MAPRTPNQLAEWANVPLPLAALVFDMNARYKKCSIKRLRSSTRVSEVVRVRLAIAREAARRRHSYSAIGRALNRDHSTIMYAVGALRK